jgi:ketosteroid isomerase-like protein
MQGERELVDLEHRVMEAIRARDVTALADLLTDDFILREPSKPDVGKRAFLDNVRERLVTIERIEGDGVRAKVAGAGDVGLITGTQRVRVRLPEGVVDVASAFADLCTRAGGRWQVSVALNVPLGR